MMGLCSRGQPCAEKYGPESVSDSLQKPHTGESCRASPCCVNLPMVRSSIGREQGGADPPAPGTTGHLPVGTQTPPEQASLASGLLPTRQLYRTRRTPAC